jgi:hypothetical protein
MFKELENGFFILIRFFFFIIFNLFFIKHFSLKDIDNIFILFLKVEWNLQSLGGRYQRF